ncbi:MAG: EFR1 family ferrodoxin [Oscillospiraceae bacterium]|nr:EFR1 family ferrodoxin [Oscillospiraceae bacterium]
MIFYFTGTGNSLAAARKLLVKGEQLIDMAEARRKGQFRFTVPKGERTGFVYPEYCSSVGATVRDFIEHLELENAGYVYAVATLGGKHSISAGFLKKLLKQRGLPLHNAFYVRMPDNCIIYLVPPSEKECAEILDSVNGQILKIREEIVHRTSRAIPMRLRDQMMQKCYLLMNRTKPFRVTDACIHCGKCEKNCPSQAIRTENGKPVWVSPRCDLCLGCINRCPVQAIEYGSKTVGRSRYVNPILR